MLDLAGGDTTDVSPRMGVVACALYRDGQRVGIFGTKFNYLPKLVIRLPAVLLLMLAIRSVLYYLFRRIAWF